MKTTLRWIYPEGASIVDAMLFSREEEKPSSIADRWLSRHVDTLAGISMKHQMPTIAYPYWHIYLREKSKPFIVSYPFGLNRTAAYNVRITIDQSLDPEIYEIEISARYNINRNGHIFYPILVNGYTHVVDYISLAASAQSAFHGLFPDSTHSIAFANYDSLYDSVADYSSQTSILPQYNTHKLKAK
jgi:hypothetical protein